jgi:hypothetical protein
LLIQKPIYFTLKALSDSYFILARAHASVAVLLSCVFESAIVGGVSFSAWRVRPRGMLICLTVQI